MQTENMPLGNLPKKIDDTFNETFFKPIQKVNPANISIISAEDTALYKNKDVKQRKLIFKKI